jgi:hypothetical protein
MQFRDLLEIQRGQPVNGKGDAPTGQTESEPKATAATVRTATGLPSWNTAVWRAHPAPAT